MRTYKFHGKEETITEVVRLYESKKTTLEIATIIGKSRTLVCYYLKNAGIQTRKGGTRILSLQEDFFESIDSHEKAYWLGFLLADGHIPTAKRTIRLELKAFDREHISQFLKSVGSDSRIREAERRLKGVTNTSSWTILCSRRMAQSLISAGWNEFKKQGDCRIVQSVPDEFKPSLLRGLFDGDGCFMEERATFVDAHLSVVYWFQEQLVRLAGIRRAPVEPNPRGTSHIVKWSGGERLCRIRDFLYSTPGPFLQRKKDVACQYSVKVPSLEKTTEQSLISDGMKWCPKCEIRKNREQFSRSSRAPDKLYHVCKMCWNSKRDLMTPSRV